MDIDGLLKKAAARWLADPDEPPTPERQAGPPLSLDEVRIMLNAARQRRRSDVQLADAIREGVTLPHLLYLAPDGAGPLAMQAAEDHRRQCPSCRAWLAKNARAAWKQRGDKDNEHHP